MEAKPMTKSTRWDMARNASERPLPKPRKLHGPVGEQRVPYVLGLRNANGRRMLSDETCFGCGYHVCSCKAAEPVQQAGSVDVPIPTPVEIPQCIYCGSRGCHRPSCLVLWNQIQRDSMSGISHAMRELAARHECCGMPKPGPHDSVCHAEHARLHNEMRVVMGAQLVSSRFAGWSESEREAAVRFITTGKL